MATTLTPSTPNPAASGQAPGHPVAAEAAPAGGATRAFAARIASHRRWLLFAAAVLMLAAFVSLVTWSAKPSFQPLYAGMDPKDASAVVDFLQKEHIPYKLEGAGTVLVPADRIYATRLKLAGQDITPGGGMGFELFDRQNEFGISDFTQQVNYQRALQGELARTIEVMPSVAAARVQLVLPKESAFADRDRKASASVMLKLSGNQRLNKRNVLAIQNLVASSVPGLEPKAVTVVDASGNLLSENDEDAPMTAGQTLADAQARIERRLEARLTGMLEQVVGPGQAVVRVTAEINREVLEANSKRFNPDEQVVRSQKEISESRQSTDAAPIGVPGTASNTPGANPAMAKNATAPAAPKETASRTDRTVNYEISTTTEHRIVPAGGIRRISVAAIVGGSFSKPGDTSTFKPRSKQELKVLQGLIEKAIGYNEDRGDTVEIQSLPLMDVTAHPDAGMDAVAKRQLYMDIARYALAALALALLAWFVLRPLSRRLAAPESSGGAGEQASGMQALPAMSAAAYERVEAMEQARQAITREPDRAARVVGEWLEHA